MGAVKVPEKNSILNKIKQSVGIWINRKILLQIWIFCKVSIDVGNIRFLL